MKLPLKAEMRFTAARLSILRVIRSFFRVHWLRVGPSGVDVVSITPSIVVPEIRPGPH